MSETTDHNGEKPIEATPKPPRSRRRDEGYATKTREVMERYGGRVIAVYDCEVWGVGDTANEALSQALAKPGAPPAAEFVVGTAAPVEQEIDLASLSPHWRRIMEKVMSRKTRKGDEWATRVS